MHFITSPYKVIGIDVSDLSAKAVEIDRRRGELFIKTRAQTAMPEGAIQGGEIFNLAKAAQAIKKMISKNQEKFSSRYVVASLPETKTFLKLIEIEKKEKASLEKTIYAELPKHIPAEISEMIVDWQLAGSRAETKTVFVAAVEKKVAKNYAELYHQAGLEVVAFEPESEAIYRAINKWPVRKNTLKKWWVKNRAKKDEIKIKTAKQEPKKASDLIIDLGATRTNFIMANNKTIQFSSCTEEISGNNITTLIAEKKKLSWQEAEKAKIICGANPTKCKGVVKDIIQEATQKIAAEIINTLNFYQSHFGEETGGVKIVLASGGAAMSGIHDTIADEFKREVIIANPTVNLGAEEGANSASDLSYTTAIGLALRNYALGKL